MSVVDRRAPVTDLLASYILSSPQ